VDALKHDRECNYISARRSRCSASFLGFLAFLGFLVGMASQQDRRQEYELLPLCSPRFIGPALRRQLGEEDADLLTEKAKSACDSKRALQTMCRKAKDLEPEQVDEWRRHVCNVQTKTAEHNAAYARLTGPGQSAPATSAKVPAKKTPPVVSLKMPAQASAVQGNFTVNGVVVSFGISSQPPGSTEPAAKRQKVSDSLAASTPAAATDADTALAALPKKATMSSTLERIELVQDESVQAWFRGLAKEARDKCKAGSLEAHAAHLVLQQVSAAAVYAAKAAACLNACTSSSSSSSN
jgi:hypothetical protein